MSFNLHYITLYTRKNKHYYQSSKLLCNVTNPIKKECAFWAHSNFLWGIGECYSSTSPSASMVLIFSLTSESSSFSF